MGVVYEAEDSLLKRKVAIKLLPKDVSANPEALKRFLREAQGAAKLNHPNVLAVYDIGETDGTHYIVLELVKGGNAQEVLASRGAFHWTEATSILIDVCRGVAAAHKAGLIHRDIKPANILRSTQGTVKLGDFGLVKLAGRKGTVVTSLGAVIGTPHYMSPEQTRSAAVDERSDLYALGATYFALLTGRPPYEGTDSLQVLFAHCSQPIPDPRTLVADIPAECTAIIRKAMAKNRAQRHASATELLADLEQVLTLQPEKPGAGPGQLPLWTKASPPENTNPLSLATAYPGEHTEVVGKPHAQPWNKKTLRGLVIGLLGFLAVAVVMGFLLLRGTNVPVAAKNTWPELAAAAENAIRNRSALAMKKSMEAIKVMQRSDPLEHGQQDAMRRILGHLEKALAFRESITEKGLVLGLDGLVTSVVFSPDDHWLAVGQGNGGAGALIWDAHGGQKAHTVWPQRGNVVVKVQALAFSHDSTVLAAGCADQMGVKLWRRLDGRESALAVGPGVNRVLSVAFAPSSRRLVAGLEPMGEGVGRPYLKAWDIDTGIQPFAFKAEHSGKIRSVAFTTGGEQVATGSQDKRVILWNADTGRIWREVRTGIVVQAIACAPQGRTLAVAGMDQQAPVLQFWDYAGNQLQASKPSPDGACRCVAFSRHGDLLASSSGPKRPCSGTPKLGGS